jgi:hypothetical protein
MIAHVPAKIPGKSSIANLANYITASHGKTERVEQVWTVNCQSQDYRVSALEIEAVQRMNTRAKSDKTLHLILSFPDGERLSHEELKKIEEYFSLSLGYDGHQRICAIHNDTDNLHVHIAINKIHPEKITYHEPHQYYVILANTCKAVEKEFSLEETNHTFSKNVSQAKVASIEKKTGKKSFVSFIQDTCLESLQETKKWDDFEKIITVHNLQLKMRGNGIVFIGDEGVCKGSTVSRDMSKSKLEEKFGIDFLQYLEKEKKENPKGKSPKYRDPVFLTEANSDLYKRYRIEQKAYTLMKGKALQDLYAWKAVEVQRVRHSLDKKTGFRQIKAEYVRRRGNIYSRYRRENWNEFLTKKASGGNATALLILQKRSPEMRKAMRIRGVSREAVTQQAKEQISSITKRGTVIYKGYGGAIREDARSLKVEKISLEVVGKALEIAHKKYGERLKIEGSAEFKAFAIVAAARKRLPISFVSTAMEERRQGLIISEELQRGRPGEHGRTGRSGRNNQGPRRRGDLSREYPRSSAGGRTGGGGSSAGKQDTPGKSRNAAETENSLRRVPARDLVSQRGQGSSVLLQGDVSGGLVPQKSERVPGLRWNVSRPGVGPAGKQPPPASRGRLRPLSSLQLLSVDVIKRTPKVAVSAIGKQPPPVREGQLRSLSSVQEFSPKDAQRKEERESVSRLGESPSFWKERFSATQIKAAEKYIEERTGKRKAGVVVPVHIKCSGSEKNYLYGGVRRVETEVLVLLRSQESSIVYVLPVTEKRAAALKKVKRGAAVRVDRTGNIQVLRQQQKKGMKR